MIGSVQFWLVIAILVAIVGFIGIVKYRNRQQIVSIASFVATMGVTFLLFISSYLLGYETLKNNINDYDEAILKDDIFYIDILARKNKDEQWWRSVEADIGSTVEFCIRYENTSSDKMTKNITVFASLPDNMEYVDESATLFNSSNPKGLLVEDPCVAAVNIGHYKRNGNAELHFKAIVTDTNLEKGRNELRVWAKITETKVNKEKQEKREALQQHARVYVEKQ